MTLIHILGHIQQNIWKLKDPSPFKQNNHLTMKITCASYNNK